MKSAPRLSLLAALVQVGLLAGGCASSDLQPMAHPPLMPDLRSAIEAPPATPATATPAKPAATAAAAAARPAEPDPSRQALAAVAATPGAKPERRFSVVLNNAAPEVVFMAILNETPLSVAVDPSVKGPMSITLKDVTLHESLELLRELHGLDYKVIGRHILVSPAQMQTRMYKVDYPSFNRSGRSDLRVLTGSITGGGGGSGSGSSSTSGSGGGGGSGSGGSGTQGTPESSRVTTAQRNDLWVELESSIKLLVGDKEGRHVIVSPQTGNIIVRAMPREQRAVTDYLEATRLSVERQVMLEAKVVEVQLRDSERTGINWAAFKAGLSTRISAGVVAPGGNLATGGAIAGGLINVTPGDALSAAATSAGALMGLAFQTTNFASVLEFLGTQGNTQVLSSPRIATMNNQKAVLKVGTDDFFVTSISTTTTPVGNTTSTTPTINVTPFFSGISLDVTPSINDQGAITLHIHPAVSNVTERNKVLNLGTLGTYSLPLASSDINESDAVVRAQDGHIIAIGGLMRQAVQNSDSGMPGFEGTALHKLLGGQRNKLTDKRELVILLKPTIVDPAKDEGDGRADALKRLLDWTERQPTRAPATK
jgi:MSHA biogenesis protein MshL